MFTRWCCFALTLLCALPARAAATEVTPRRLMVMSFGTSDPASLLYDAIELDLELVESAVLTDPTPLQGTLGAQTLLDLNAAERSQRLRAYDQDAALHGRVEGLPAGQAVLALVRAADGEVVYLRRVELEETIENPREWVIKGMLAALGQLDALLPISTEAQRDAGLIDPEVTPPPAAQPPTPEPQSAPPSAARDGEADTTASRTRAAHTGHLRLSYLPAAMRYRACQPTLPANPLSLGCTPRPGTSPTEVLIVSPLGLSFAASYFPVASFGFLVEADVMQSRLQASNDDTVLVKPFSATGGNLVGAIAYRHDVEVDPVQMTLGARLGYHLSYMMTEAHGLSLLDEEGRAIDPGSLFNLIPSWLSHTAVVGGELGVAHDGIRLLAAIEAWFLYHHEYSNYVGSSDPFGVGGRAQLELELDLGHGFYGSALGQAQAISVQTQGAGRRMTRELTIFQAGHVELAEARLGLGIGYRF